MFFSNYINNSEVISFFLYINSEVFIRYNCHYSNQNVLKVSKKNYSNIGLLSFMKNNFILGQKCNKVTERFVCVKCTRLPKRTGTLLALMYLFLHIQVRCLKDHGEFEIDDGTVILLKKNSQVTILQIMFKSH